MSKAVNAYLTDPRSSLVIQLMAAIAAFWPVWLWYCERTVDRSDEPLGLVALLTVVSLIYLRKTAIKISPMSPESVCRSLAVLLSLVLLYCVIVPWAPNVVLALIAISVVAISLFRARIFGRPLAGDCVLMLLSIPLVASLNFYFGYPMRLLASFLAAAMLNLGGLAVSAQGAEIVCNSSIVGIDQPCSGIKMLWVALYLAATLSSLFRFNSGKTINMLLVALAMAIVANAIRVSSLFYIETKIIDVGPHWHGFVHSGIGVASFALLAVFLVAAGSSSLMRERTAKGEIGAVRPSKAAELKNMRLPKSPKAQMLFLISFTFVCLFAAAIPFTLKRSSPIVNANSWNWPDKFEGQQLTSVPLSKFNLRFADGFPGRIAVFRTGSDARVVFRCVTQPTRQLHASVSCYKASGYTIKWMPDWVDSNNQKWTVFEAKKGDEKLSVRERFYDENGNSWTDVSSWYWSAVLNQTKGPWWALSVAQPINSN